MSVTPNLNLNLPNFNNSPWHDDVNDNFRNIDATIKSVLGLDNLKGAYQNSTAVTSGERYFDTSTGFYYEAQSAFTTEAYPTTFATERANYPARWQPLDASEALNAASNAAASAAAAATSETNAATSETNAATSESNAATSASNASTSETNAASSATTASTAATNAAASETAAAGSASSASTSETNAANSATSASASATAAATSETNAATSETNANTSAINAAVSEANASTSETNAANSASAAATSASNAETAWDNFDDRYLGPKTSDPTVDNDGNALTEGALYWNSTNKRFRVYNALSWEDATNTVNRTVYKYTATSGQTVFSGLDDGGQTLDLTDTFYTVYLNGVRLIDVDDYTKTDTSITLVSGVLAGDELIIEAYTQFSVADVVRKTGDTMSGDLNMDGNNITQIASLNGGPLGGFRNKIINGGFDIWQRGTTVSGLTNHYGPDRWKAVCASGITCQADRSVRGTSPDEEYYGTFTFTGTGSAGSTVQQRIESVNTLAGKTVTVSGELAMDSTQTVNVYLRQYFGSGGAPSASVDTLVGVVTAPAGVAWQQFSLSVALPSISGKTIGTAGDDSLQLLFELTQPNGRILHLRKISVVEGDATGEDDPFEQRPLALEDVLCMRYYQIFLAGCYETVAAGNDAVTMSGSFSPMRTAPTLTLGINLRNVNSHPSYPPDYVSITKEGTVVRAIANAAGLLDRVDYIHADAEI